MSAHFLLVTQRLLRKQQLSCFVLRNNKEKYYVLLLDASQNSFHCLASLKFHLKVFESRETSQSFVKLTTGEWQEISYRLKLS